MNWRPFTLPATLPVTRIFSHYPTRTLPEVKKPYPSQPDHSTVRPTVRRHKMGSLEKDVRGKLIQQVKENNWNLGAEVKFDELARLPHFEGS